MFENIKLERRGAFMNDDGITFLCKFCSDTGEVTYGYVVFPRYCSTKVRMWALARNAGHHQDELLYTQ